MTTLWVARNVLKLAFLVLIVVPAIILIPQAIPARAALDLNSFAPEVDFVTNGGPTGVAVADIDGDGKADLALSHYGIGGNPGMSISVLRNTSTSGNLAFDPKVDFATNAGPYSVALGDVDGDGKVDVVTTNYGTAGDGSTVSVLRNTSTSGSLAFAAKLDFGVGNGPVELALGDVDGDGRLDVVVSNYGDGNGSTVSVLRNISTGGNVSFGPKLDLSVNNGPVGVALGDVDGDGKPDLVVSNYGSLAGDGTTISVLRNTSTVGNVAFAAKLDFTSSNGPRGLTLSDLDGDGKSDVVVANFAGGSGNSVSVLRNTSTVGNVALAPKVDFAAGTGALHVVTGDLDGDGKPDVAVSDFSAGAVSLLQNNSTNGTVALSTAVDLPLAAGVFDLAMADLDGDYGLDLAMTNYGSGNGTTVSLLRNLNGGSPPTLVNVPDVVGQVQAAAEQAITGAGLSVGNIGQTNSTSVPAGNVISQNPAAGTSAVAGSPVHLVVSLGPSAGSSSIGPDSFAPKVDFATNAGPTGVAVGDLDGDGKPDLAVSNYGSVGAIGSTVSVLHNTSTTGNLSFDPKVDFTTSAGPHGIALGDLDGDGKSDLVMSNYGVFATGTTISVLRNTSTSGSVAFASNINFATRAGPVGIAIRDLDGDGKSDLIVSNFEDGRGTTISILRNTSTNGSISFAPKVDFTTGFGPYGIGVADLNSDGKPDLAVANYGTSGDGTTISVLRNISAGGNIAFAAKVDFTTGTGPRGVAIGDVDRDSNVDLIVGNFGPGGNGSTISVLRNTSVNGNLAFTPKVDFTVGAGALTVELGDIDKDGALDVAVTDYSFGNSATVSVLRNTSTSGTLAFAPKVDYATGDGAHGLALADLDGDNWLDLSVTNYGTGNSATVSLLRNTIGGTAPTLATVPDVVGQTQAAAQQAITNVGLSVGAINQANSPTIPAGNVISQIPTAGASVVTGSVINLVVSLGPPPASVPVPNVVGQAQAAAEQAIINAGLSVDPITEAYHGTMPPGNIISQNPVAGAFVAPGSAIGLVVSLGPPPVGSPINANSFATQVNFATNSGPISVVVGDIDGDGKPDLVVPNYGHVSNIGNTLSVLLNTGANGAIAFAPKLDFVTVAGPHEVVLGDIDRDSKLDVVMTNYGAYAGGHTMSVLRNISTSGNVTFAPELDFDTEQGPMGIALGDLDGDGKPDLIVTNLDDGRGTTISVFRNTSTSGNVSFAPKIEFTSGVGPYGVAVGDLDGDGKPELVVSNNGTLTGDGTTLSVLQNTSTPGAVTFAPKQDFPTSNGPRSIGLADLDGDGKTDIVVSSFGGSGSGTTISALRNTSTSGSVAFAPTINFTVGSGEIRVVVGDIDKDGKPDVAVANFGNTSLSGNTISVLRNISTSGNLTLAAPVTFATGTGPHGLALYDLNGDGGLDMVAANYGSFSGEGNTISVLRNMMFTLAPNTVGLTQAAAQQAISDAGLTVGTITQDYHDTVPAGSVGSQNPSGGTSVSVGATIDLVISLGHAPATLTLATAGNGSGTVTSTPTGIDCGTTCSAIFNYNTSVTLSPAPNTGSSFTGWSGACMGTGTCVVTMDAAKSVTASFTLNSYALTVNKNGNGSGTVTSTPAGINCGSICSVNFVYPTSVTLSPAPNTGSSFTGWSGACTGTGTCVVTMDAAKSVTANFTLNAYTLSLSKSGNGSGTVTSTPAGINCGSICSASFLYPTSVTLSAAPNTGSSFTGWSGACTGTGTCVVTMDAAKSVTANFTLNAYTLSLSKSGNGSGTVTSTPAGINCGSICSASFLYPTSVTLSPAPNTGSSFTGWSGACTGTGTCVVTMDAAKSVTANFTLNAYTLSLSKSGNGSGTVTSTPAGINCGSICSASFLYPTSVTLSAAPNTGSSFTGWSGACTGTGTCVVTMDAAKSVTANFTLNTYTLSLTKAGSGTVTSTPAGINCGATCSASFTSNTSVSLSATPDAGWTFTGWSGDLSGTTNPQTISLNGNKSVTANFSDLIFADDFENGNLSSWSSSTTDSADLRASTSAALVGGRGMQAVIDDNNSIFVTDDTPNAESYYWARFFLDPNSISMSNGNAHYIFYGYSGNSTIVLRIEFRFSTPKYQIRAELLNNGSSWTTSNWFDISDAPHSLAIHWQAASSIFSSNGSLSLWIDNTQKANLTGVSNSLRQIDRVRLGAVEGIDNGTRGTYYFDAFESHRGINSGPAATVTAASDAQASNGSSPSPSGSDLQVTQSVYLPMVAKGSE